MAGLLLDPWQEFVLAASLGERRDGKWSAFEVGLVVPRQNGKGGILEGRELAGLFLLGERFIVHSAHQFDTSLEAFRRLLFLIEGKDEFARRVKKVSRSHGEEGIELTNGQRIRFRTRTKGGGRGFSGDLLVLDEAMDLQVSAHGALLPTLSARPNSQVWYTGSAVDQNVHEHGMVLTRVRMRGHRGDPNLAFFEWCANADFDTVDEVAGLEEAWADANPGLGYRIAPEHVALEQVAMDPRTFAVERLGVGDWPTLDGVEDDGITREMWDACLDELSSSRDPVRFAVDVRPDRRRAAIGVAGLRPDGMRHVEIVDHRAGTGWVAERLAELLRRHPTAGPVILAQRSPAAALIPGLIEEGVPFDAIDSTEYAQACGVFFDSVEQRVLRHLGTSELAAAVRGAAKRTVGDAWAWSRKNSAADISPLVVGTLALWGALQKLSPSAVVMY